MKTRFKAFLTFVLLALVFVLLSFTGLAKADTAANEYFSSAIKKAAVSYAVIRGVNSVVSVIKGSSVSVSPAGVGLEIAFGEILDPIDDLTQKVSNVLVAAIVALGIEKIVFELAGSYIFPICAGLTFALAILSLAARQTRAMIFLAKILAGLLILRLLLPLSAFVSAGLNEHLFSQKIEQARQVLTLSAEQFKLSDASSGSMLDGIIPGYKDLKEKFAYVKNTFGEIQENAAKIIDALVSLATIYVFMFLLDAIVLPLAGFVLIYKSFNALFAPNRPGA